MTIILLLWFMVYTVLCTTQYIQQVHSVVVDGLINPNFRKCALS